MNQNLRARVLFDLLLNLQNETAEFVLATIAKIYGFSCSTEKLCHMWGGYKKVDHIVLRIMLVFDAASLTCQAKCDEFIYLDFVYFVIMNVRCF